MQRFEPAYKRFAHDFPQHRFFRLDGNLNSEARTRGGRVWCGVHLARVVRLTPHRPHPPPPCPLSPSPAPPTSPQMVRLGRDVLGVKTTPSFFFFRNGELVHRCAGAREDLFLEALKGAAAAPQPLPTLLP